MSTKIVKCECPNKGQDELHGAGNRVANYAVKPKGHRCTVCGKIHKQ